MKLLFALFAVSVPFLQARAQSPASSGTTAPIATQVAEARQPRELLSALLNYTWGWEPKGREKVHHVIRFYQDGIARVPGGFSAAWEITGLREVTLTIKKPRRADRTSKLSFDPNFSHYEAVDFDNRNTVKGVRKEPVDATVAPQE